MSKHGHPHDGGELHPGHIAHPETAYDRTDLSARGIFIFLIGLAVSIVIIQVMIWGFVRVYAHFEPKLQSRNALEQAVSTNPPRVDPVLRFPAPQLQPDPVADMNKFRAKVEERLNSSGDEAGVKHIPIEQAIEIVAQRGLPVRQSPPPSGEAKFGDGDGSVEGFGGGTAPHGNK